MESVSQSVLYKGMNYYLDETWVNRQEEDTVWQDQIIHFSNDVS